MRYHILIKMEWISHGGRKGYGHLGDNHITIGILNHIEIHIHMKKLYKGVIIK
jgi:hypothetical protein